MLIESNNYMNTQQPKTSHMRRMTQDPALPTEETTKFNDDSIFQSVMSDPKNPDDYGTMMQYKNDPNYSKYEQDEGRYVQRHEWAQDHIRKRVASQLQNKKKNLSPMAAPRSKWGNKKNSGTDYVDLNKKLSTLSNYLGNECMISETNVQSRLDTMSKLQATSITTKSRTATPVFLTADPVAY